METFQNTIEVLKHCGGEIGNDPGMRELIQKSHPGGDPGEVEKAAVEIYLAVAFI
jgi:hypothetical protein